MNPFEDNFNQWNDNELFGLENNNNNLNSSQQQQQQQIITQNSNSCKLYLFI